MVLTLCAGGVLVAAGLGQYWLFVRPLPARVDALRAHSSAARDGALQGMGEALAGLQSQRQRLDHFYRHLERDNRRAGACARGDCAGAAAGAVGTGNVNRSRRRGSASGVKPAPRPLPRD